MTNLPKILRILLLLTIGLPYLAIRGLVWLGRKAWQAIVIHRGLQIFLTLLLFIVLVGVWKFGPLVTGRLALQSAAETLARGSEGRSTVEVEHALRRKAFRMGFRSAITEASAVSVERTSVNGITLCTITFEFHQEVDLLGLWRRQMAVSGRAEEPVEPPEKGGSPEELLGQ